MFCNFASKMCTVDITAVTTHTFCRAIEHPTYSALTRPLCELSSLIPPQALAPNKKLRVCNYFLCLFFSNFISWVWCQFSISWYCSIKASVDYLLDSWEGTEWFLKLVIEVSLYFALQLFIFPFFQFLLLLGASLVWLFYNNVACFWKLAHKIIFLCF